MVDGKPFYLQKFRFGPEENSSLAYRKIPLTRKLVANDRAHGLERVLRGYWLALGPQCLTVADQLSSRLVPDELWELVEPHLPRFQPRPAGRRHCAAAGPAGLHRDRVRADQRVRLAGAAALVRGLVPDRPPPVHHLDESRALALRPR
jgi:hypothetical protein